MILELSGFYLKVGQVFATKSDLLPPQYVAALKSVFDDCPPVPASKIDSILRKEFGGKHVSAVFKSFDTNALASATTAQVHVAHVDVDGKDTKVAVKVQKPNIAVQAEVDLLVLRGILRTMQWSFDLPLLWTCADQPDAAGGECPAPSPLPRWR